MSNALLVALIAVGLCGVVMLIAINAVRASRDPGTRSDRGSDGGSTANADSGSDCGGDGGGGCD